jgi:uncharacterized membrane protein
MKLRTLLVVQGVYAALALGFLGASGWHAHTTGAPLSAAPVVPSVVMFLIYVVCLLLPRLGRIGWYRVAMAIAIVPFGIGGVVLNILNYAQNGLRDFSSFEIWVLAIAINGFGTAWNVVAAVGAFDITVR